MTTENPDTTVETRPWRNTPEDNAGTAAWLREKAAEQDGPNAERAAATADLLDRIAALQADR